MFEYQITSLAILALVILMLFLENVRIKKFITPFSMTALPFLTIFLLANFFLIHIGFPPVTIRAQFFILIQLIIIWIAGLLISRFFDVGSIIKRKTYSPIREEFNRYNWIILILAWFAVIVVGMKSLNLLRAHGGWIYFGNPEYEDLMSRGLSAHVVHLGRACFVFLIFMLKKRKLIFINLITLLALFVVITLVQIKYLILYLILMTFLFYNAEARPGKQLKNLALAALTLLLVFNLFWVLLKIAWGNFGLDNRQVYLYIARMTANYLASGPMLLDHWLSHPFVRPDWTLWIIFENVKNVIMGNPIRYSFVPLVSLGFERIAPQVYSNVGTSFGSFFLIGGWPLTLAYSTFTAILYYVIYFFSYQRYHFFLVFLNLFLLTVTTLSFFGQYYTILSTYEMPLIFLLLGYFFKFLNYLRDDLFARPLQ